MKYAIIIAIISLFMVGNMVYAATSSSTFKIEGENGETAEVKKFTDPENGILCYYVQSIGTISCLKP